MFSSRAGREEQEGSCPSVPPPGACLGLRCRFLRDPAAGREQNQVGKTSPIPQHCQTCVLARAGAGHHGHQQSSASSSDPVFQSQQETFYDHLNRAGSGVGWGHREVCGESLARAIL